MSKQMEMFRAYHFASVLLRLFLLVPTPSCLEGDNIDLEQMLRFS